MSGVVLEQVNQVVDIIQVVDSCNSEFLGVGDSCAEEESSNSAEAVDSELHWHLLILFMGIFYKNLLLIWTQALSINDISFSLV
jgi:hypothetical protein